MTAVHHPAPLNQFYRLDYDEIAKRYVKTTRWNHSHLRNGFTVNYDSVDCMVSAGAMLLDAHTGGAKRTTPGGIHDHQDDMVGGVGVDDVQVSWKRGWGEALYTPADFDWADTIYTVRTQRRCAIIGVDYDYVPYDEQVQKNGSFDHAIVIDDYRSIDSRIRRLDSLDTNAKWTAQSAYKAAAEALALRVRGSRSKLFVAFTRSRPLLTAEVLYRVAMIGGTAHPTPLRDKPYGTKVGSVSIATYTCTRHKVSGQWWYQILPTAKTANRGLWISPTRYTKVSYL